MVTTEQIKELRDKTGVSVMACKRALEEADGDTSRAILILRKEGVKVAGKKSERELGAGVINAYVHANKKVAVLVHAMSETDFVAKNPEFDSFVHDIAMHIAASDPADLSELLEQPFIKDSTMKIEDLVNKMVQKFGENIRISKFIRYSA